MTSQLSDADVRAGRHVLRTMLAQSIATALFAFSLLLRSGWFLAAGSPLPGGATITWVIAGASLALLLYGGYLTIRSGFGPHTPGTTWWTLAREAVMFLGGWWLIVVAVALIAAIRAAPVPVDLGFTLASMGVGLLGITLVLFAMVPPIIRHVSEAAQVWHDLKTWPQTALYMRRYGPGKPRKPKRDQRQSGGAGSVQVQVGGDLKIGDAR